MLFKRARFKLTLYYVAIIMVVSFAFSTFVYKVVMSEVGRGFRLHTLRGEANKYQTRDWIVVYGESIFNLQEPTVYPADQELFEQIRARIIAQLAFVNAIIFIGSSLAGYFLSGKTLQPIELMVEDQRHFVANASHELRTPLTALKTEIEVALRDKKLTFREARNLLRSNLDEVNKMQTLSNYLLSLTKYEKGDKPFKKQPVQLNKVLQRVLRKFSIVAREKQIEIDTTLMDANVQAHETSIEELFSILLDNALKYSRRGDHIKVIMKKTKKHIIVRVNDTGMGISAKDLPHIFNRFYRADISRTKQNIEGYGLGLAIAKSIVDLHEGRIIVKSEVGHGSTFTVWLPS